MCVRWYSSSIKVLYRECLDITQVLIRQHLGSIQVVRSEYGGSIQKGIIQNS